jgi:hypothetical protein
MYATTKYVSQKMRNVSGKFVMWPEQNECECCAKIYRVPHVSEEIRKLARLKIIIEQYSNAEVTRELRELLSI